MVAGSRSFAAIGQWAADAGPEVLAVLGAARGPAEESTFRRAFALVSADVLDRVLGAWLHTRAVQAGGRLVIAIDGKAVRGAKDKGGKAPHLVAALAHGIGAVLGQVAVEEKPNEIPAVRDLLKAFASLTSAVVTTGAMHTQHDTAQVILGRGAGYVMTVKGSMPTLCRRLKKLPWAAVPLRLGREHRSRPPGLPHHQGRASAGLDRVRGRCPGRAAAANGHEEGQEDRRCRLPDHQRPRRRSGHPGGLGPGSLGDRKPPSPIGQDATTFHDLAAAMRVWAKGLLGLEAAVELLIGHGGRRDRHAEFRQFAVDPAVPPQRILLRQANDEPGDAPDRGWAAGLASVARVILLRGQPAVPGEERRRCHREDFGPAVTRYEPSQPGEPNPVGRLVTYPAGVAAHHRVLVPEDQQFGILRQVRAEHQDGQAEDPAN